MVDLKLVDSKSPMLFTSPDYELVVCRCSPVKARSRQVRKRASRAEQAEAEQAEVEEAEKAHAVAEAEAITKAKAEAEAQGERTSRRVAISLN